MVPVLRPPARAGNERNHGADQPRSDWSACRRLGHEERQRRQLPRGPGRREIIQPALRIGRSMLLVKAQSAFKRAPLLIADSRRASRCLTGLACRQRVAALERVLARQQYIADTGQRIHIIARYGSFALQQLATRECRRGHGSPRFADRVAVDEGHRGGGAHLVGDAKVQNADQ